MMVIFMWFQSYFFGVNDTISLILLFISTLIIYQVMNDIQVANKRTLRVNAKKDSFLYKFLSYEKSILTSMFSLMLSFFLSVGAIVTLKGIVREQGGLYTFLGIGIISFIIFIFINQKTTKSNIVNNNLHEDISNHINILVFLFTTAMILNIFLSAGLSYHDTKQFLDNDINIGNFDSFAIDNKVDKTGNNDTSRLLLNLYVLIDHFKQAVASIILNHYIDIKEKDSHFTAFYFIIFIFNILKLFAFSFSFVLLQKGFENIVEKIFNIYNISLYKTQEVLEKNQKKINTLKNTMTTVKAKIQKKDLNER